MKAPLGPKSSGRALWEEVQRLRRNAGSGRRTVARAEYDELKADLERTRTRAEALLSEVSAARTAASDEGVAEDSVGGKPALAKMRATWNRFASAVLRLPATRAAVGMGGLRLTVAKNLSADLSLFELDAPHGERTAEVRNLLRRQLSHPSLLAALASDGSRGDYHRALFLFMVERYFLRPSIWRIYEKASDEGLRDTYGTVLK